MKDNHRRWTMHRFIKYMTQALSYLAGTQRGSARFTKTLSPKKTAEQQRHDLPQSVSVVSYFSRDPEAGLSRFLAILSFFLLTCRFVSSLFLRYFFTNLRSNVLMQVSLTILFCFCQYSIRFCSASLVHIHLQIKHIRHESVTSPEYLIKLYKYKK
jgi:hypothetical protein